MLLMNACQWWGAFLLAMFILAFRETAAFHHVFAGTGALEVQLIAAKLALKAGDTVTILGQGGASQARKCVALMYGSQEVEGRASDVAANDRHAADGDDATRRRPEFAADGDSTGLALSKADGIIIACEDRAVEDGIVDALLDNAPRLRTVALLSAHGGKFEAMENSIRAKCEGRALAFSVLRAGILVGGGPGGDVEKQDGEEWGLSKYFYDNKFDLTDAMTTMSMDKFTMGVRVTPGDPFKGPNFFSKIMAGNSFEPRDGDTGRVAAAHALLAAVRRPGGGLDVSLSTAKGSRPLSFGEWDELLSRY